MSKSLRVPIVCILLVCLVGALALAAPDVGSPSGLVMTLTPNNEAYMVAEPATLTISVRNSGPNAVDFRYSANESFRGALFVLRIYTSEGALVGEKNLTRDGWTPAPTPGVDVLQPGAAVWCKKTCLLTSKEAGEQGWEMALLPPGSFFLECSLTTREQQLRSERVAVRVAEPGGDDASASRLIMAEDDVFFLGYEGAVSPRLAELLRIYPETVYGQHVQFRYLIDQLRRFRSSHPTVSRETPHQLVAKAETLLEEHPDFPVADELVYLIARVQRDDTKELLALRRLVAEYPESPHVPDAQKRIVAMEKSIQQAIERGTFSREEALQQGLLPEE